MEATPNTKQLGDGDAPKAGKISIVLADDHPIFRAGVATVLAGVEWCDVVAEAGSGEQAIAVAKEHRPHVLLLDVRLPGLDGIDACAHLATAEPSVRTVILTQFGHEAAVTRAFAAGAKGFLLKDSGPDVLRKALLTVMADETYVDPGIGSKLINVAARSRRVQGPYGLTFQEMRIIEFLPKGLSNAEIGAELNLSPQTVKTHVSHIIQKLEVNDRAEAAALAIREGLA